MKSNIKEYIMRETPEMKKLRIEKSLEVRRRNKIHREQNGHEPKEVSGPTIANRELSGIRVNILQVSKGCYLKGTSRTILVPSKSFNGNSDELRDEIVRAIREIKQTRKTNHRVIII